MSGRSVGLLARQKRRADLDALSAERERRGDPSPVGDSASGDHRDVDRIAHLWQQRKQASQRRFRRPKKRRPVTARLKPDATTTSTPDLSSATASSTVVAAPMVTIDRRRHSSGTGIGGTPNTKLKTGGLASRSAETCSSNVAHPRNGNVGGGMRSSLKNGASGTSAAS